MSQAPPRKHDRPGPPPTGAGAHTRSGRWDSGLRWYAPAALASVLMLLIGLWGLARDSALGNDEVATKWAARITIPQLFHLLNHLDAVHGLYYLLMHFWLKVGSSPAMLRVPSLIAMAVAVGLTVILARQLSGSGWIALFTGLIMLATPSISFYAQTARSYAMVFACVIGLTLILLRIIAAEGAVAGGTSQAPAWRWYLAYALLLALTGYLNEVALLVLAAHLVTLLLARAGRPALLRWFSAAVVGVILVGPLLVISGREGTAIDWIGRPGPAALLLLGRDYFGGSFVAPLIVLAFVLLAFLPWRRDEWVSGGGRVTVAAVAGPLVLVPAGLLLLESTIARPLYVDRYVLYGEAGAALLAATGILKAGHWLRGRFGGVRTASLAGLVICVALAIMQIPQQHHVRQPASRLFDFGGPAQYISAHARPGDGVLFVTGFYRKDRLAYPDEFRNVTDFAMGVRPVDSGTFQGRDRLFPAIEQLMPSYRRIWVVGRPPSNPPTIPLFRREAQFLESKFVFQSREDFQGITVSLWIRRSG